MAEQLFRRSCGLNEIIINTVNPSNDVMPLLFTRTARTDGRIVWLGACALLVLTGCASTAPRPNIQPGAERELRAEVATWRGTPHRWGGTDRSGADCSGFVMALYRDVFGADVPRTTEGQVRVGEGVRKGALRPGDLVFFRPSRKTRHVGVYLGGGEFAHASSSAGVTVSRLDQPYWQRVYWRARRLLPHRPTPLRAATSEPPRPASAPAQPDVRPKRPPSGW